MQTHKVCSFFGHREINITEELKQKTRETIENLIKNNYVSTFIFGSRSNFNYLCHLLVTELKDKYSYIKRIGYSCRNETCILETEKEKWEEIFSRLNV